MSRVQPVMERDPDKPDTMEEDWRNLMGGCLMFVLWVLALVAVCLPEVRAWLSARPLLPPI